MSAGRLRRSSRNRAAGLFVHMTSTSGLVGNFGQANYCAAKLGVAGLSKAIALDMQKFSVRSNAVAPFAWTRMVSSIPDETPEQKRRVEGAQEADTREDRSVRRRALQRSGAARDRPDLWRAQQRDLPVLPAETLYSAHRGRRTPQAATIACCRCCQPLLPVAPLRRRVHLGPGVIRWQVRM